MGCCNSGQDSNSGQVKESVANESGEQLLKTPLKLTVIEEFPFYVQTPPILNGNEAIFLYSSKNGMKYSIYNLKRSKFIKKGEEIKCDDSFDVFDSVYALNPKNNKIYFLVNNRDVKALNLNENVIESLNKTIITKNDNYALITYHADNIYIIGGEEGSEQSDEYIIIPYSTALKQKSRNEAVEVIKNFGQYSRICNTLENGSAFINLMGGQLNMDISSEQKVDSPNDSIWRYNITQNKWHSECHLIQNLHSFGIINYNNKYLISFGGEKREKDAITATNIVSVLSLQENDKYGLQRKYWYEGARLRYKDHYNAMYIPGEDRVHLINYKGNYYTLKIQDILDRLRGCHEKNVWSEAGKTVLATKSKRIKNMGPKDIDDDEDTDTEEEEEVATDKKN